MIDDSIKVLRALLAEYALSSAVDWRPLTGVELAALKSVLDSLPTIDQVGYPAPTVDIPDISQIMEWIEEDSGCEATDGCWVEPDGVCEHGFISWAVHLGLI